MPLRLLLLAASLAFSQNAAPPPPISLTVSDDLGEAAYRPKWSLWGDKVTLQPVLKAGALAFSESFPYPYPILKRSPFAMGGLTATYHGPVEAMVSATIGYVNLNSQRLLDDPTLSLGSPASAHPGRDISQNQLVSSVYADVGKTVNVGGGWKGAFYAAYDAFVTMPTQTPTGGNYTADGLQEGSVGTSWLYRKGRQELSLNTSLMGEGAPKDFYRNDGGYTLALSQKAGAEYSIRQGPGRWLAGTEVQTRRADESIRPYLGLETDKVKALLGAEWRVSKNDFYPSSNAVAASIHGRAARDLMVGIGARYESKRFSMAPGPVDGLKITADLTWTPGGEAIVRSAKSWGKGRKEEYDARKQQALNAAVTDAQRADIRALIAASPTLRDFLAAYKPSSSLGILAAASEFTNLFSQYNYNNTEGKPENLDSLDAIYRHARQSYLTSTADPTLVCLGAAQFTAALAEELGRRSGIPIEATAITVKVPNAQGIAEGHAVAAVKTLDHGIVFVDWGRLIPTYTFDTERAFRVYQALVGVPALFHEITDPNRNGRHVGYLFTEEGKLYVNNLTFHGELPKSELGKLFEDDPRGDAVTTQRYKDLLRRP
jgi:hypothetical protein